MKNLFCLGFYFVRLLLIWLVVYLPLWKTWVRQLGWWTSQYMESHKIPWFQSPPTSNHYHIYSNVITVILSAVCIAVVMPIWCQYDAGSGSSRDPPWMPRSCGRRLGASSHKPTGPRRRSSTRRWRMFSAMIFSKDQASRKQHLTSTHGD